MGSSYKMLINKLQIESAVHYNMCSFVGGWCLGKILISKKVTEKSLLLKNTVMHKSSQF